MGLEWKTSCRSLRCHSLAVIVFNCLTSLSTLNELYEPLITLFVSSITKKINNNNNNSIQTPLILYVQSHSINFCHHNGHLIEDSNFCVYRHIYYHVLVTSDVMKVALRIGIESQIIFFVTSYVECFTKCSHCKYYHFTHSLRIIKILLAYCTLHELWAEKSQLWSLSRARAHMVFVIIWT